jgi:hypothetical protein
MQKPTSSGGRWLASLLAALGAALVVAACGGGGGGDPGTGGTGSFSRGAITGFGSIIVNGVRHDDSRASVSDEDDEDNPSRSKDDLKLGMVVTISGSAGTGTGTATANVITFGSELKGPVASINGSTSTGTTTTGTGTTTTATGTQTLVIIGQTVLIGTRTVFDPLTLPGGFADIQTGDILEVHGHLDAAANKLTATRISKEDNADKFKISGRVASLNAGSKTFKIGQEMFSYGGADPDKIRVQLADGINVKLRLATTQSVTGTWDVTRIKPAARKGLEDKAKAELEGIVADLSTNTFTVNGIEVDATNAEFPKGKAGLENGARVEVKGSLVGGVLIASRVKVEDDDDEDNEIELHGQVASLDTTAKTFDLRGLTVDYSAAKFENGSASNLADGRSVEVKGANAAGGVVKATKIEFEN